MNYIIAARYWLFISVQLDKIKNRYTYNNNIRRTCHKICISNIHCVLLILKRFIKYLLRQCNIIFWVYKHLIF